MPSKNFIDFSHFSFKNLQHSWRKVVSTAVLNGIPTPAFSSALAFYDGLRTERLPANLLQVYTNSVYISLLTFILCRHKEICLELINMNFQVILESLLTPTGPEPEEMQLHQHIKYKIPHHRI